uniref:ZU5 domain-containing protein n=1 Tax=Bursaphelenchus xylophilus TaxID=6326 RepID=A0A1I7S882_BURXY
MHGAKWRTHIDFNGCRIANVHAVYTGTTRRLEIFKQVGVGEEVSATVYNRENVEYTVNKTALSLNTGYDDLLPMNCHGIFKLNKQSQIVIPVIVQFSESTCVVEVEFINGIPQSPDKRKLDVPDRAESRPRYDKADEAADRRIQALDSQHFSRYDDETLFITGDRTDPNSYWKLFATMAASIVFILVGIGYFLVTKFKPAVLGRIKPSTMSFSNPNIELNNNPTPDSDSHAASNQVIFSSGGVIFKNVNATQEDQHGFSNRVYEQSL